MKFSIIEQHLVELTAAIAAAATLVLIALPVQV